MLHVLLNRVVVDFPSNVLMCLSLIYYMYGQPQVSSASVNLTTETAVVWPVSDAKSVPDWQKIVGTELAKHLTSCGFQSNLRGKIFLRVHC